MPEFFLSLDAGTTNTRAMVVGGDGSVLGQESRPLTLTYPEAGRVETDAEQFWDAALDTVRACLLDAGLGISDVAAMGVTGQRTSLVVWEKDSGVPVSPIVSWQDLRGIARSRELAEAGYPLIPLSAACKLECVLEDIPDGRDRFNRGELAWGNVDTFLAWRLSDGAIYATDASQACATGYMDLVACAWDGALIAHQGLNPDSFPSIVDTMGVAGEASKDVLGAAVPIGAIVGDQQCAALAQGCLEPGEGKVTFGTSGTCNVNTGDGLVEVPGTYPLVLYRVGGKTVFCVEGMVITAGAMLDWLVYGLGIANSFEELEALAGSVPDSAGVRVLPALQGLGSPHADSQRAACIEGLTRGATKAHVARAALEGVAFRTREMLDNLYAGAGYSPPTSLLVDGGLTRSGLFLQILSDATDFRIDAMSPSDATTYGAAVLAGTSVGRWGLSDLGGIRRSSVVVTANWSVDERSARYRSWQETFGLKGQG